MLYVSTDPEQTEILPKITGGVDGFPFTVKFRAALIPQALVDDTEIIQLVKLAGKSKVAALKVLGPFTVAPPVAVHKYPIALVTADTE